MHEVTLRRCSWRPVQESCHWLLVWQKESGLVACPSSHVFLSACVLIAVKWGKVIDLCGDC